MLSFNSRTYTMYATLRKRGPVSFTLTSFRDALERFVEADPLCRYCKVQLMLKNVSTDHIVPLSRGGGNQLRNLQFICKSDNKAKGNMRHEEYEFLLGQLRKMEKKFPDFPARKHVVSALRISNSFRQGAARRAQKAQ
jgi:5-methylcytosine-specific restriction endonuclease McrA